MATEKHIIFENMNQYKEFDQLKMGDFFVFADEQDICDNSGLNLKLNWGHCTISTGAFLEKPLKYNTKVIVMKCVRISCTRE